MTLSTQVAAYACAQSLIDDASLTATRTERLRLLASACVDLNITASPIPEPEPEPTVITWQKLTQPAFPSTVSVIRGSVVRGSDVYVSTGGSAHPDAQCWKRSGNGFVKHSHFNKYRMNVLLVDEVNDDLYMGLGSQRVPGSAFVCKYDAANNYSQIGSSFSEQDTIYSLCWHEGKLHAGTFAEDVPGSARVAQWVGGQWQNVFAPGLNGLPSSYSYAGAYVTFDYQGMLHAGMFSRTAGDAHVWRKTATGWINLGCPFPDSGFVLANIEHDGKLIVCFSTDGANGPVRAYNEATGTWDAVGNIPAEWAGATIFNHMAHDAQGRLVVGVGGAPGKLSAWRLEGDVWTKLAGSGVNGSWTAPLGTGGAFEWIYRLVLQPDGAILACVSSEFPNGSVGVWQMTEAPLLP